MICAFNREGILTPDTFLSDSVPGKSSLYNGDGASVFQVIFPEDFQYSVPSQDFSSHQLFDESKPEQSLHLFMIGGQEFDMHWYLEDIRTGRNTYSNTIRDALKL